MLSLEEDCGDGSTKEFKSSHQRSVTRDILLVAVINEQISVIRSMQSQFCGGGDCERKRVGGEIACCQKLVNALVLVSLPLR